MEGSVGSRRAVVFLTILGLAFAGCGGDDDNDDASDPPETVDSGLAVQQDAEAKADARNLVVLVEVCYVDNQDYSQCLDAGSGEDVGAATVQASSAMEFMVISPSESGNEFRVGKGAGGALERTCEQPAEGGCPASGKW
jgi:hypothetical protein